MYVHFEQLKHIRIQCLQTASKPTLCCLAACKTCFHVNQLSYQPIYTALIPAALSSIEVGFLMWDVSLLCCLKAKVHTWCEIAAYETTMKIFDMYQVQSKFLTVLFSLCSKPPGAPSTWIAP